MVIFAIVGIILTLLILGGGTFAWWYVGRQPSTSVTQRRHRAEARQVQGHFDADEDFARNFHRPTQNEVLETLQMLDHLTPQWDQGDTTLVEKRLKNELAESFPALRKAGCDYPIAGLDGLPSVPLGGRQPVASREDRNQRTSEEVATARNEFRSVRAQANALHQLTTGTDANPLELTPGSLPFRVSDDARSGRSSWVPRMIGAFVLAACLALAGWYAVANEQRWNGLKALMTGASASPAVAPTPTITAEPIPTATAPQAVTQGDAATTTEPPTVTAGLDPTVAATSPNSIAPVVPPISTPTPQPTISVASNPPSPLDTMLAQEVAASQLRAIDKYPELAVPNSEINLRFVFRYKNLVAEKSTRLQDSRWPEKLADECATAATPTKSKKITQTAAPHR